MIRLQAVLKQRSRTLTKQRNSLEQEKEREAKKSHSVELTSVVTKNLKNIEIRDVFLKMMLKLDSNFVVEHFLRDVSELERILENASPFAIELFNSSCFYETPNTQKIHTLRWPGNLKAVLYSSNSLLVTQQEIQEAVDGKKQSDHNVMTKVVTV